MATENLENLTIPEAAKQLRNLAEMTSKMSQNWDNFEKICEDFLNAVYKHGKGENESVHS